MYECGEDQQIAATLMNQVHAQVEPLWLLHTFPTTRCTIVLKSRLFRSRKLLLFVRVRNLK
jgi:hypothetical protein